MKISYKADFRNSDFSSFANFADAIFSGEADFMDAVFSGEADFMDAIFSDDARFVDAVFSDDAVFSMANFGRRACFGGAILSSDADFEEVNFSGLACFGAVFSGEAYFMDANFSGFANFEDAVFIDDVDFRGAYFSGYTYIDDAYFGGDADFSDAYFSSNAIFRSTEFNKVYFIGASFTNVSLNGSNFNSMNVEWRTLKDALVFDGPTYVKLIRNFREMEQFEDADAAYYQYRRLSQANKGASVSKLGDIFMWLSCGYGVRPHYTIGLGVAIILLFSLIYWRGNGIRRLKEIGGDDNRVSFWDALYFSMVTFTTVGFGDWYPADRYRVLVMIEGFVGWLTLALFLVTLANVMIRP